MQEMEQDVARVAARSAQAASKCLLMLEQNAPGQGVWSQTMPGVAGRVGCLGLLQEPCAVTEHRCCCKCCCCCWAAPASCYTRILLVLLLR
jgi:hypothetical protein